MSASKSQSAGQLKWHNTLQQDFSSRQNQENMTTPSSSLFGRKRHSGSAEGLHAMMNTFSATESLDPRSHSSSASGVVSPTKRHRSSNSGSQNILSAKTPTKSSRQRTMLENGLMGSGMQTPPPSSTGTVRRRGGRGPTRVTSASKTAPVGRSKIIAPPQASPTKSGMSISGRTLQPRDESAEIPVFRVPDTPSARKALFWDNGIDRRRGEITQSQFDLNAIRGNLFTVPDSDSADVFSAESAPSLGYRRFGSPTITEAPSDSAQFSFMGSDDRQDFEHKHHVNPNLLFSEPGGAASSRAGSFNAHGIQVSPSQRPYHHQYLQRLREQEERARRRRQQDPAMKENSAPRHHSLGGRRGSQRSVSDRYDITAAAPRKTLPRKSSGTVRQEVHQEVVLAISPGGRAKAQTIVYEQQMLNSPGSVATWDSLDESDSSFDGDTPRGLAPDGGEYITFRRQSLDPPRELGPSGNTRAAAAGLRTPRRSRVNGVTASTAATATAHGIHIDLDSSPKLPTPFRSSPPVMSARRSRSGNDRSPTRYGGQVFDDSENSEAETVVDVDDEMELPPLPGNSDDTEEEAPSADETDDADDAVAALKRALGRGRSRRHTTDQQSITPNHRRALLLQPPSTSHRIMSARSRSSEPPRQLFRTMTDPAPRKLRQNRLADGGFASSDTVRESSVTTISDPEYSDFDDDDDDVSVTQGDTRCICGKSDDQGKTMVQCDSCKNWLHLRCLGYTQKTLPNVFVCAFCIEQRTPQQKHLRNRGMARVGGGTLLQRVSSMPVVGHAGRRR